jgi:PKD repeat protein
MKVSPNGKKIGLAILGIPSIELYDFDNSTGVVSNSLILYNTTSTLNLYGCEFSPDGTKLYASGGIPGSIFQWDICAGNNAAIVASKTQITNEQNVFGLQCAPNGKIYVAHNGWQYVGAINNPNAAGAACNYTSNGLFISNGSTISPLYSANCFPNFVSSAFRQASPPFTYSALCQNVSFTNAAAVSTIINNCAAATYSLASYSWNFGDPLSGAANNTSTAQNPKHQYSSTGTFTTTLVLNYQCYSDTLKQTVNVSTASPTFAVSGATAICKGEKTIYTASGAQNYTWAVLPSAVVNASIALNPTLTTQYTVSATNSLTGCRWDYVFALTVNKCLNIENTNTVFNHLAVFPNPVKEMLHVEMDILNENTSAVDIEISNALGQIVYSEKLTQAKTDINTAQWAKGIYFMKVKDAEKEGVKRIVVE